MPEKALEKISRVLKPGGILIAPNFVGHEAGFAGRIWSGMLKIAGIRFEHQWTGISGVAGEQRMESDLPQRTGCEDHDDVYGVQADGVACGGKPVES